MPIIPCTDCGKPHEKRNYAATTCQDCADKRFGRKAAMFQGNVVTPSVAVPVVVEQVQAAVALATNEHDGSRYGKRHKPGVMNKTEAAYAEILQSRKLNGEIIEWWFESQTFKLADGCRYTPDFDIWLADGRMEFVDTKGAGPMDDKGRVKIKMAAEKFRQYRFVIEQKLRKKDGGDWKREIF